MTGFEVYKMYLALKQHFTKEKYDYHKYRGKVRASEDAFEQRHDRYFFKKLATNSTLSLTEFIFHDAIESGFNFSTP